MNIVGNPDIVEEYHKYTYVIDNWDSQKSKAPKLHRPNITRGQDERDIVDKAVQCMNLSFCTIAHVRLEPHIAELIHIKDEETTQRLVIETFRDIADIRLAAYSLLFSLYRQV